MNKLTADQLILLNRKITGEADSVITPEIMDELKKITEEPYRKDKSLLYIYRRTADKAARLGCLIATRAPFEKENLKTAILAMLTLVEINGYRLCNYTEDLGELRKCLSENNTESTCRWIRRHLEAEAYRLAEL